jgi:hypothetical protein
MTSFGDVVPLDTPPKKASYTGAGLVSTNVLMMIVIII